MNDYLTKPAEILYIKRLIKTEFLPHKLVLVAGADIFAIGRGRRAACPDSTACIASKKLLPHRIILPRKADKALKFVKYGVLLGVVLLIWALPVLLISLFMRL